MEWRADAAESKEENMRYEMETNGLKDRWRSKTEQDEKGETEKRKSKNGMEFCLREQGIGDECGKVLVSVWRGKEVVHGEIWVSVRRKENVGDVV